MSSHSPLLLFHAFLNTEQFQPVANVYIQSMNENVPVCQSPSTLGNACGDQRLNLPHMGRLLSRCGHTAKCICAYRHVGVKETTQGSKCPVLFPSSPHPSGPSSAVPSSEHPSLTFHSGLALWTHFPILTQHPSHQIIMDC